MKFVCWVVLLVLASSTVLATGMGVPSNLKGTQTIDGDNSNTLTADVLITGGANRTEITFFAEINATGLNANGKNPKYTKDIVLQNYETEIVTLNLKGLKDGVYLVTWGFIEHADGNGMPIDTRVDKQTVVKVRDVSQTTTTTTTNATTTHTSGGGGGGNAGVLPTRHPENQVVQPPAQDPVVQDVAGQDSGIAQGVVGVPPAGTSGSQNEDAQLQNVEGTTGKSVMDWLFMGNNVLIPFIAILSLAGLVSCAYAVRKAKMEERS